MKSLIRTILSFLPRRLPVGMTAFDEAVKRVYALTGDICTENDVRYVMASAITHMGPNSSVKSDRYFLTLIRSAAAKQIAGAVFQDIRQKQAEAQQKALEEAAAKQAEATAQTNAAASNEQAS
jgi:hypothetical protein